MSRHTHRRTGLFWASAMLILGVVGVVNTNVSEWWWGILPCLCLLLVPGLISDAAADEIERRQNVSRPDQ